jgi:hypothetical protein
MAAAAAAEVNGDLAAAAAAAAAAEAAAAADDDDGNINPASVTIRFRIGLWCTAYGNVMCHHLLP